MGLFRSSRGTDESLPRDDRGVGSFDDYGYDLTARKSGTVIVLADSNPCQDELRTIVESGDLEIETAISPRPIEQERVEAPIVVRLVTGRRVSAPVGSIPRGLESVVDETLRRLDDKLGKARIPVRVIQKGGKYRVELLMGKVR